MPHPKCKPQSLWILRKPPNVKLKQPKSYSQHCPSFSLPSITCVTSPVAHGQPWELHLQLCQVPLALSTLLALHLKPRSSNMYCLQIGNSTSKLTALTPRCPRTNLLLSSTRFLIALMKSLIDRPRLGAQTLMSPVQYVESLSSCSLTFSSNSIMLIPSPFLHSTVRSTTFFHLYASPPTFVLTLFWCVRGSEGLEDVAVERLCLVRSLDRLSGFLVVDHSFIPLILLFLLILVWSHCSTIRPVEWNWPTQEICGLGWTTPIASQLRLVNMLLAGESDWIVSNDI